MTLRTTSNAAPRTVTRHIVAGRYMLERKLGVGGMGQVYLARHLELGKAFALKIIAAAFADNEAARARFNQEAKLASEISHPNIVSVVDYGEDPRVGVYMVMELVDGVPLIDPNGPPISIKRALDVLGQLADVLDHIHRRGIIHGDVKAENIMMVTEEHGPRRRQVVRLLDFGLAQRHGTHFGAVEGTPQYLSPERVSGGAATIASDVYALGVLGYEMIAGRLPFDGAVDEVLMAQVYDEPVPMATLRGEPIDPAIGALIHRAMAKNPAERHQSARAFRYELNTVMDMLAMSRRGARLSGAARPDKPRDATIAALFDRSRLPQALIRTDGEIAVANRAFAKLVGLAHEQVEGVPVTETALVGVVPDLMHAIRTSQLDGRPVEQRARVARSAAPPLDLVIWISPFNEDSSHVLVRIAE